MPSAILIEAKDNSLEDNSIKNIFIGHENISLVELNPMVNEPGEFVAVNTSEILEVENFQIGFVTASIAGLSTNFIVETIIENEAFITTSIAGVSQQNTFLEINEIYSNEKINIEQPSPQQSLFLADINHTPSKPKKEKIAIIKNENKRDISRFRKSYSFTRNKPVKIRTTKRI